VTRERFEKEQYFVVNIDIIQGFFHTLSIHKID